MQNTYSSNTFVRTYKYERRRASNFITIVFVRAFSFKGRRSSIAELEDVPVTEESHTCRASSPLQTQHLSPKIIIPSKFFQSVLLTENFSGDKIEKDEMGRVCSAN
jgi:hypothetical protein